MDRINNNNENSNSFDSNFDGLSITCDDVRNHNESRTTARIPPLSYHNNLNPIPSFSTQEYRRSNVDRMKDQQISILIQNNNKLQTELLAMRQKYPILHEYSMMGQLSNGNLHSQNKLLTTALSEKFEELKQTSEELRQTKKEYELVMQERTTVHRELQEQTAEIDMLKGKIRLLQDQLNFHSSSNGIELLGHQHCGGYHMNSHDCECKKMKSNISILEANVKDLKIRNERTCLLLNTVLDKYYKLKMVLSNDVNSNRKFKSQPGSRIHEKIVTGSVKVIDIKMVLLNIAYEKTCTVDENGFTKSHKKRINNNHHHYGDGDDDDGDGGDDDYDDDIDDDDDTSIDTNAVAAAAAVTSTIAAFRLRNNDELLNIEGTCVAHWSDNEILEHLTRYDANSFLQVMVSRKSQIFGKFLSWKMKADLNLVKGLSLSPLWMITKSDNQGQDLSTFKFGDILQLNNNKSSNFNKTVTLNIIRLSPFPLGTSGSGIEDMDERRSNLVKTTAAESKTNPDESANPLSTCMNSSQSFFPVLPTKQKLILFNENHFKDSNNRISSYDPSQHSNISVSSAPPIPPRSSTSLQYSFMENLDHQNTSNMDIKGIENREFMKEDVFDWTENEKLNLSVQSAIQFNYSNSVTTASRELMSASFNCTSEFSSNKIPKLGKCRKVTLTVPSKIFCLRDLGLHLLHGKTEEPLKSKSDVDVSVVNQIFIRNVELNSIAQAAGLVEGDEIITINNHPVSKMTAEEAESIFLTNSLKPSKQKSSLLIKVQFNPLKMHELCKEKHLVTLDPNLLSIRFTRSMYDETNSNRSIYENGVSHHLHAISSSSNLNIWSMKESESSSLKHNVIHHLQTHPRIVRINLYTVLKLIKVMGGCNVGIFITNVIYKDSTGKIKDKESIGNRLAVGDKILEVNGEAFDRMIGDVAIETLNKLSHQTTIKVVYDPPGLLAINSDPLCQERFYMEATFSFSELHNPLTSFSRKRDKSVSVCSRLDHLVVNIRFIRNYHLRFEKNDILLVDATILPSSMTKHDQDEKYSSNDWHAWVVDKKNNKLRQGMIPSAFWVEKVLSIHSKSFKFPILDRKTKSSMHSTPSSPISETNDFISSPTTSLQNDASKMFHTHQSSLSHRLFSRISFKSHVHARTVSNDDTNKCIIFQKFKPLKRLSKITDSKRPIILLGAHSDTFAMVLASSRPQEFIMVQSSNPLDYSVTSNLHQILLVTSKDVVIDLIKKNIFPIVLLLNYRSAKQIKQLRICKTSQIKVSKSDCNKLFLQIKEFEIHWSHLINDYIIPTNVNDTCETIVDRVRIIQTEDIWLSVDRYQYSE